MRNPLLREFRMVRSRLTGLDAGIGCERVRHPACHFIRVVTVLVTRPPQSATIEPRRGGGTGRRSGLKIPWPQGRVGSIPAPGTSYPGAICRPRGRSVRERTIEESACVEEAPEDQIPGPPGDANGSGLNHPERRDRQIEQDP
jgi:hypothetical protein